MQEQAQTPTPDVKPDIKNEVPIIQEDTSNYAMIVVIVIVLVVIVVIGAPFFFRIKVVDKATDMRDDQESEMVVEPTGNMSIEPTKSKENAVQEMCQNELVLNEDIEELNIEPNQEIAPFTIVAGKIKGSLCFEGVCPIRLVDGANNFVYVENLTLNGVWTTDDLIPFAAMIRFDGIASEVPNGKIMIMANNASGLPDHSYCYQIPVKLSNSISSSNFDGLNCEEKELAIKSGMDIVTYCNDDKECSSISLGCPFGCFSGVNTKEDISFLEYMAREYGEKCPKCLYSCASASSVSTKCVEKKCITEVIEKTN